MLADAASACERSGLHVDSVRVEPASDGLQAELRLNGSEIAPVVGLLNAVPGVRRLEVGAAERAG